jgi:hypothetical protein
MSVFYAKNLTFPIVLAKAILVNMAAQNINQTFWGPLKAWPPFGEFAICAPGWRFQFHEFRPMWLRLSNVRFESKADTHVQLGQCPLRIEHVRTILLHRRHARTIPRALHAILNVAVRALGQVRTASSVEFRNQTYSPLKSFLTPMGTEITSADSSPMVVNVGPSTTVVESAINRPSNLSGISNKQNVHSPNRHISGSFAR